MLVVTHIANEHFRKKCASKRLEYNAIDKNVEKKKVQRKIFEELKTEGYCFVRQDKEKRNQYNVIAETDMKFVLGKIRQCIRDSNKRSCSDISMSPIQSSTALLSSNKRSRGSEYYSTSTSEQSARLSTSKQSSAGVTTCVFKALGTQQCYKSQTVPSTSNKISTILTYPPPEDEPYGCTGKMLRAHDTSQVDAVASTYEQEYQFWEDDADLDFQHTVTELFSYYMGDSTFDEEAQYEEDLSPGVAEFSEEQLRVVS
jgi:hypothetical protein